jgi:hypothetical protein
MNTRAEKLFSNLPFRIRVGVVGAELLPDGDKNGLASQLRQVFLEDVVKLYDEDSQQKVKDAKSTVLAFSVLTTLAGETERLAAKIVLEQPHGSLDVALPCSQKSFERDFIVPTGISEFRELIKKARRPIDLRKRRSASKNEAHARAAQLAATWQFIADHSDLLILLPASGPPDEAMARIADHARGKGRPVIIIPAVEPSNVKVVPGKGLNASPLTGIEAFNSFPVDSRRLANDVTDAYNGLFSDAPGVDEASKDLVREYLLPYYARASSLAERHQRKYQWAGILVYSFSAAAVGAVAFGTLVPKISPWAFGVELVLLISILVAVVMADWYRTHSNWIENRFLAERLRAAQFLAACHTEVTPIQPPPHLVAMGRSDDWTLMAFNEIWQRLPEMKGIKAADLNGLRTFVSKAWLDDQIDYHNTKVSKSDLANERLELGGVIVFSLALIAAALHLILHVFHITWMEMLLTFAAIVLPSVGAAIGGIKTHREYSRLKKRSENMVQSLSEIKTSLDQASNTAEFEVILREIEQMMLIETQDWLMLMRFAELEAAA